MTKSEERIAEGSVKQSVSSRIDHPSHYTQGREAIEFIILLCTLPIIIPAGCVVGLTLVKWYKRYMRR